MKKIYALIFTILLLSGLILPNFSYAAVSANENSSKKITIFHTNDMHGRLVSGFNSSKVLTQIGADYVKSIKKSVPGSLLIDAGDATQGLPFANISKGADVIKLMNAAGYDGMTFGNHEFDFGKEAALENAKNANFPVVSANTMKDGKPLLEGINGHNGKDFIKEVDGVKVGFYGITTEETAYKTNPKNIEGVKFESPVETSKIEVKKLKEEGADVIVGVMHIGNDTSSDPTSEKIAEQVDGIDVLIDGHSHSLENTVVNKTLIVQTEAHSVKVGKVEIEVENGKVTNKKAEMLKAAEVPASYTADKDVTAQAEEILKSQQAIFAKVVGRTKTSLWGGTVNGKSVGRMVETNLGNLIADSMIYGAESQIKGTEYEKLPIVSLENGGGIRETIPEGYITRGQVISVLPFGNILSLKVVTPDVLYKVLENGVSKIDKVDPETGVISGADGRFAQIGGMRFEYDYRNEAANTDPKGELKEGKRVTKVVLLNKDGRDGKELKREDKATKIVLASNDFEVAGGDGYTMLAGLKNIGEGNALDVIFEDYIKMQTKKGNGMFSVPANQGRSKALTPYKYKPYSATITLKNSAGIVANKKVSYWIDKDHKGTVKSDSEGNIIIKNIPSGPHSITITDGNLSAEAYLNDMIGVINAPAALSDLDPVMAAAVANIIADLSEVTTLKDEESILFARRAYNELTEDQRELVKNYDSLVQAEAVLGDLKAAAAVEKMVSELPATIKLSDQGKIMKALTSYNKLSDNQKALVPNYAKLSEASEKIIALLIKDKQDGEASLVVIKLIDAIPAKVTEADLKTVKAARSAYDKLTADQKKKVYNYRILTDAEKQLTTVKSVSLNKTKATLKRGSTLKLTAKINPTTATNKKVTWSSSNKNIVTVDSYGKVTAKKTGKATITVKTVSGGKTAECTIQVVEPVKSVKLNKQKLTLKKGKTFKLKATINPSNATNKAVTWSTSHKSIATVDKYGKVTAKKKGTATITVKTADGGKKATCKITVQ